MLTGAILMTSSQSKVRYVLPFVSLFNGVSPEGWDMLTPQNTRVGGSFKANALDQLICKVKDCFSSVGTVVDSSTGGSVEIRKPPLPRICSRTLMNCFAPLGVTRL